MDRVVWHVCISKPDLNFKIDSLLDFTRSFCNSVTAWESIMFNVTHDYRLIIKLLLPSTQRVGATDTQAHVACGCQGVF